LAAADKLLWPVAGHANEIRIQADPLLLDAVHALLLRHLGELKKQNRTGPSVAGALRQSLSRG